MIDPVDPLFQGGQLSLEVLMAALQGLNGLQIPAEILRVQLGNLLLHPFFGLVTRPVEEFHAAHSRTGRLHHEA